MWICPKCRVTFRPLSESQNPDGPLICEVPGCKQRFWAGAISPMNRVRMYVEDVYGWERGETPQNG